MRIYILAVRTWYRSAFWLTYLVHVTRLQVASLDLVVWQTMSLVLGHILGWDKDLLYKVYLVHIVVIEESGLPNWGRDRNGIGIHVETPLSWARFLTPRSGKEARVLFTTFPGIGRWWLSDDAVRWPSRAPGDTRHGEKASGRLECATFPRAAAKKP